MRITIVTFFSATTFSIVCVIAFDILEIHTAEFKHSLPRSTSTLCRPCNRPKMRKSHSKRYELLVGWFVGVVAVMDI